MAAAARAGCGVGWLAPGGVGVVGRGDPCPPVRHLGELIALSVLLCFRAGGPLVSGLVPGRSYEISTCTCRRDARG